MSYVCARGSFGVMDCIVGVYVGQQTVAFEFVLGRRVLKRMVLRLQARSAVGQR